ncbi:MAG: dockerin type I domain-containing protein, partial [Candidatus Doudnabacteria bacterium]|nr:dockerin type I domain-containing protein [Candidatus Doudnabacteria bacterium]
EEFFAKTATDKDGVYLYNFDTSPLSIGQHLTKSKTALAGEISSFSKAVGFTVGDKNVVAQPPQVSKSDTNNDGRVNLVDFSIAAYWYKRPSPPSAVDLSGDGKVDLVDFSIMAFYWTG